MLDSPVSLTQLIFVHKPVLWKMETFLLCCKDHPYIIDDIKGVIRYYLEYRPPEPPYKKFWENFPVPHNGGLWWDYYCTHHFIWMYWGVNVILTEVESTEITISGWVKFLRYTVISNTVFAGRIL